MKRSSVYFASIVLTIVLVMCIASSSALKTSAGEKKKSMINGLDDDEINADNYLIVYHSIE